MRDALFALGVDPATMTDDQRNAALALSKELKKSGATNVNVGERDIGKLPVGVQSGIVGAQGARDAIDRYEGYAKQWLALPVAQRAVGQLGVPNTERDTLLGNIESSQQEMVLTMKNLAELGVLTGPDMDILTKMIGDPASKEALYRSPEYMLTRIERVREYIDDKVSAYERTYDIEVPKAEAKSKRPARRLRTASHRTTWRGGSRNQRASRWQKWRTRRQASRVMALGGRGSRRN
jgi:hypothetical protein